MPEGCPRCGVRADLGCKHQQPEGAPPPAVADPAVKKPRKDWTGQGWNFHRRKQGPARP